MSTVGEQLREEREARNLTIYQVAEETKIRTDHIRALEEGDYDMFTAQVYIRGFVRNYGQMLKLDVAQLMSMLEQELGRTGKFAAPPPLMVRPKGMLDKVMFQLSRLHWRILLPLLAVLLLVSLVFLGLRACQSARRQDPLSELGPGLYQPLRTHSGELLPLPTNATSEP
ncbi:MAG TPA: helix-turn-helix domain-containing protein [Methylomirabilota bacterium]|nr:helix-turn-helix domain-containing protein [Methylomirabilota bacterium]